MSKKSNELKEKALELKKQAEEAIALLKQAEEEEAQLIKDTETKIKEIADANNVYCGVILTKEDILGIVSLAIDTNENIKIPFRIYPNA